MNDRDRKSRRVIRIGAAGLWERSLSLVSDSTPHSIPEGSLPGSEALHNDVLWLAARRRATLEPAAPAAQASSRCSCSFAITLKSSSVVVSPTVLLPGGDVAQQPAHDLAGARLGQRVGEADVRGLRDAADLVHHVLAQILRERAPDGVPRFGVTKATIAVPVRSSGRPTTAASATCAWATSALSTSIEPMRWPETFITSSMRPMIQK